MRILYVARHNSGGADDEGSIDYALEKLGHEVIKVEESQAALKMKWYKGIDFLLFHKWSEVRAIRQCPFPKVFWYFDLVNYADPKILTRCRARMAWMAQTIPSVDLGFCTDGDWVANDKSGKLIWLTQGADERVMGLGISDKKYRNTILFTGISRGGGLGREAFVDFLKEQYGSRFFHVEKGVYRRDLADLIVTHAVTVAPDSPVTDRYWSNRVYNALGFGAFLLHPYSKGLEYHYPNGKGIVYYNSRDHLKELIDFYTESPLASSRRGIAAAGYKHTMEHHTYRHRCEALIRIVKERLRI